MVEDVAITFETLYDILRREKSIDELQELNPSFFLDVVGYLKEKQNSLNSSNAEGLFASDSKVKTQQQLENIKRVIRDIYDLREKKIIELSRDVSRTGTNLINMKALLPEEEKLYTHLLSLFDLFRNSVLHRVLLAELPKSPGEGTASEAENTEEEPKTLKREAKSSIPGHKLVRFIEPVKQFVGPDLEPIGPFEKEDTACLPEKVAHVLLNQKNIEIVEE